MVQLDNLTKTVQLVKKPNGHRQYPARSCCDLKHDYPHARTGRHLFNSFYKYLFLLVGAYYIDPNGGSWSDGFKVMCDFEDGSCTTCIDAVDMVNDTNSVQ